MITIRSYLLPNVGPNHVAMPFDAEILAVGQKDNVLFVRAMIDVDKPLTVRTFEVSIDGPASHAESGRRFIDTVQIKSAAFHVYEIKQDHKPPTANVNDRREGRD